MKYKTMKALKKWTKENGFDVDLCRGTEFQIQLEDSLIYVADEMPEESIPHFTKLCKEFGLEEKFNIRALAFAHELGHEMTDCEFNFFIGLIDNLLRKIFYNFPIYNNLMLNFCYHHYQRLPKERRATEWACNWIKENRKSFKELENIFLSK